MTARSAFLLLLAALTGAAPVQGAPHKHAPAHHRYAAGRHRRTFRLSAEMREDGRSPANSYAARKPGELRLRPNINTRFGDGAVASFGYHPGVVAPTLGPHELDGAVEPQLGHGESSAGVSVKVPL
jgi:hypothetical protein